MVLMIHLIRQYDDIRWYNDIKWYNDICHRLQMYYVLCPVLKGSKFMVLMIKYIPPYIIVEQSTVLTSIQSFFLCVMEPQFSQAPFRNLVAFLPSSTPRLYHSPMALNFFCFSSWGR